MKNGRIILKATFKNISPMSIGSGQNDHSDRDIVTILYPIDKNCMILPPEKINEAAFFKELPYIPAASFMGKINSLLKNQDKEFFNFWGLAEEKNSISSFIDCSDILLKDRTGCLAENSKDIIEIRDGIRIDAAKGTVADGAKFDYELLAPGIEFSLTMIFRVETTKIFQEEGKNNDIILADYQVALQIASAIQDIIVHGFEVGSKSTIGFGKMEGDVQLYKLDFADKNDFKHWIDNTCEINKINPIESKYFQSEQNLFKIMATFRIKNSLIIRSYSTDPQMPDSTHLKSGGQNILSGSSIKGALRGRAERILNTIQPQKEATKTILAGLFGDVEKEADGVTVKKDGYTVPSRVFVDEVPIKNVKEEIQTRIQIDRFTGGTVASALIEEVPLFPVKDKDQVKSFCIRIKNVQPMDKGLMLLLLKDLWTADLPIGGEKSIGRGVLEGKNATIKDSEKIYAFPDIFKSTEEAKKLQNYVDALHIRENDIYYQNRVETYKNRK